ncbi:MAG: FAD-dependent monooxygenase [Verrucomicrobia bacterium]|jgi:menaquinone-9 beta-reductase|nr:FAD-dependent monooxygenase [Verrucomicrobiota bacterium]
MTRYDVVIVGAGPAGAATAILTARAGLSTLVLERSRFPREKVCGDCLNPGAWALLDGLGVSPSIELLPSAKLRWVDFLDLAGRAIRFELPDDNRGERAIRRKIFDDALIRQAIAEGAEVRFGNPVFRIDNGVGWRVTAGERSVRARFLIAADGRNSSVARLLADFPKTQTDRIALQTHFSTDVEPHVTLQLKRYGYLGSATIGEGLMNLCLVCRPQYAEPFRLEAAQRYGLPVDHHWQSITPLTRSPIVARRGNLLYVGDAGRVVEPLTGEGILYALKSGVLAAEAICAAVVKSSDASLIYAQQCQKVYGRRLWVNQIARLAVLHPEISNQALQFLKWNPAPLKYLTSKVVTVGGG